MHHGLELTPVQFFVAIDIIESVGYVGSNLKYCGERRLPFFVTWCDHCLAINIWVITAEEYVGFFLC